MDGKMTRWIAVLLLGGLLAAGGCSGCDEESAGTTTNNAVQGCEDADEDGFEAGADCEADQLDCDDDDAAVSPGAEEICGDGVDNNCDGQIDEDCQPCEDGDVRECGSDVGACVSGTQTCNDEVWGECEGEVRPQPEICDGVDNDCDGEVDEDPAQSLCDDGIKCNGVEVCDAGECRGGEPVDCTHLDGACYTGICQEKDGSCAQRVVEDGTSCEDGNFCTVEGICAQGVCESSPRDCSGAGDQCNEGICDAQAEECVPRPLADDTACDDGLFCTVSDSCQDGVCEGNTRDCSAEDDQCNDGVCDEQAGACVPEPVADDSPCDDGQYCTVGESCQQGQCTGGSPRECSALGGSCRSGTCDEQLDSCTGDPLPDGTACTNSQFCTVNDECQAGSCVAGDPRDCSAAGDQCNDGVCDESQNRCEPSPKPDGTTCDDDRFCTVGDVCTSGSCGGSSRDCSAAGDQCNDGTCDENADACVPQPVSDGTACDDNLFCTVGDTCSAGSCDGSARTCDFAGDQCNDGICDEDVDSCVAQPLSDGTSCSDGLFCTVNDECVSGSCNGQTRDCSAAAGNDPCATGVCNESNSSCEAEYDSSCCDTSVDNDLDGSNQCDDCDDTNGSVYPGATETCNGIDDDCDGLIDEDFDMDGDGYATCSDDPALNDCDDNNANVNPGMAEDCGQDGTGNGIDDDCDGYIDEGCDPCTDSDADGDGFSECDGDCDDNDSTVYPGATEICDGKDNDCNTFTVTNCDVSEPCNFGSGHDECYEDMLCACIVNSAGDCTGDYRCTPYCNWSETGPIGDGCGSDQTCLYDLLRSANIHGCGITTDTPGTAGGGEACTDDTDCRSLNCDRLCRGPGCNQDYCQDYCSSDAYCGTGAVCQIRRLSDNIDGRCWPSGGPLLGSSSVGQSCTGDTDCDHGFCTGDPNGGSDYCTEPCCQDSDCPSGYNCSTRGDAIDTTYVYSDPDGISCNTDADCTGDGGVCLNNECAWRLVETTPMCVKDVSGQGSRVAGQACSQNSECESNFCESSLGICLSTCCNDSTCPTGLTCESQVVQTDAERVSRARVCINVSTDDILRYD